MCIIKIFFLNVFVILNENCFSLTYFYKIFELWRTAGQIIFDSYFSTWNTREITKNVNTYPYLRFPISTFYLKTVLLHEQVNK